MKRAFRRVLAVVLLLAVLTAGAPLSASAASLPLYQDASEILGISERQVQRLQQDIYTATTQFKDELSVVEYGIVSNEKTRECILELVRKGIPEVIHINNWIFCSRNSDKVMTKLSFTQGYRYSRGDYQRMLAQCEEVAEYLTRDLVNCNLTPAQKALVLHDRLAVWVDYDTAGWEAQNAPYEDHTMYGALWNRLAVCDGYAKAYAFLLNKVGITSYVCGSDTLNHAWNVVYLEGAWYHVDVTWDDPIWDVTGRVNHTNFLLSTEGLRATGHTATDFDDTPTSKNFEGWFWTSSNTAFQYLNNRLYFINNEQEYLGYWEGNQLYRVLSVDDTWYASSNSYWRGNFSRLSADEEYLYYSLAKSVHRYDPVTGVSTPMHYPNFSNRPYHSIFGMKVAFNLLYCDITDSPTFTATTKATRQEGVYYRETVVEYLLVEELPTKLRYRQGQALDTSGLCLKVRYSDGTSKYITAGFTVSGFDTNRVGEQTVTVSYGGGSTTFSVAVLSSSSMPMGDVDMNGTINSTDARLVLQYAVGKVNAGAVDLIAADVNGDHVVNSTDARLILQFAVGKIAAF